MHFLGYIIAPTGVSMEEDGIQAVKNWPKLKSLREIQVFLGFAKFYRRFIKAFSRLAALLTDVIRQSPLSREDSLIRVVANVQRDVDTSRGTTQGPRGFDGAVSQYREMSIHLEVQLSGPEAPMEQCP